MVEVADAHGVVAAAYGDLLARMPFVPSLFKSLALCPQYLVLANEQAADDALLDRGAEQLIAAVRAVVEPPEEPARSTAGCYAMPIGRMLLLSAGLRLALQGELSAPSAPGRVPPGAPPPGAGGAPTVHSAPAGELYGQVRAALGTPIVNTVWRGLAEAGQLGAAWAVLLPQVPRARQEAVSLATRADELAREAAWPVVADRAALDRDGASDAAAGMAAVLDAYRTTLARVLVLAASSAPPPEQQ